MSVKKTCEPTIQISQKQTDHMQETCQLVINEESKGEMGESNIYSCQCLHNLSCFIPHEKLSVLAVIAPKQLS